MLDGFPGADAITNEELIELDCDVLAPCALEQVITAENATAVQAQDRSARARTARRRRPPTRSSRTAASSCSRTCSRTPAASSSPTSSGSRAPGVLLEGVRGQREAERHRGARLRGDVVDARALLDEHATAAYGLAVQRVAEATTIRGLYPRRARDARVRPAHVPSITPRAATSASARSSRARGAGRAPFDARARRHRRRPGAGGAYRELAPGDRDRRRAGVHLLRPAANAPPSARPARRTDGSPDARGPAAGNM